MNNTCSNGFDNLKVELVSVSHDEPFRLFWNWYRETWRELHDVEYDPHNSHHVKACTGVLNRTSLPTPMEVLNFEVRITGLSRVALAQITRGRIGHCYNVQSQMPQRVEHAVTVPRNISEHPEFGTRVRFIQEQMSNLYDEMFEAGIPPQDCRYVTMHGQQTTLMWSVNYGALLGWFAMRCENGLTDELNLVGRLLRRELLNKFVETTRYYSLDNFVAQQKNVDKQFGSGWTELINKFDCMGAAQEKCLNVDDVFGNTGRFPSAHSGVPSSINTHAQSRYRFDKSAFYLELLNMDETLLFPHEKEMIADWKSIGFDKRLEKIGG